jgi:hypothetical protein
MTKPRPEGSKRCAGEIAPDEGDARHRAGDVFHELAASVRAKEVGDATAGGLRTYFVSPMLLTARVNHRCP